ncbi:hypothetical protein N7539_004866 [Penicillium diatomitis]|uniref:Uncharacterized protein n=1 Tax=Penicillium diatomitis TaxID=2819901 RepID=A0A9W9X5M0_9EURO|nr:uncharacterized protein N7539_004866 [Penicillium diatomitis]KAJ5484878.1 hypothetical protein N7539_004866 [Penicillium diatomitis]
MSPREDQDGDCLRLVAGKVSWATSGLIVGFTSSHNTSFSTRLYKQAPLAQQLGPSLHQPRSSDLLDAIDEL